MGGSESKPERTQSVLHFTEEGPIHRSSACPSVLVKTPYKNVRTLGEAWKQSCAHNKQHMCLGERSYGSDSERGEYIYFPYEKVNRRVENFASGLIAAGLRKGDKVGIYSQNRVDWMITDLACAIHGFVTVPLYDSLGKDAVVYILEHAEIKLAVCSIDKTNSLVAAAGASKSLPLEIIVQMGPGAPADTMVDMARQNGISLKSFEDVEDEGSTKPSEIVSPEPEDLFTIMYTSGTTGKPKGVMVTHASFIASLAGILRQNVFRPTKDAVHCSYLPLAHVFERGMSHLILMHGGRIGYTTGDIRNLADDIAACAPTILIGVPRVFNRLYDKVFQAVEDQGFLNRFMFSQGYSSKKEAVASGGSTPVWDSLVFEKTASRLGGKVKLIVSGGAPLSGKVHEFLRVCFCCPVLQVYGLTEVGAMTLATLEDNGYNHVGPPVPSNEVKLVDVPDMGYRSSDHPRPRGEIWCRGPSIFQGYYKDEEQSNKVLTNDGWFRTGDIGAWNDNGTLSIIDRVKNLFKLSQGEYVAPEYIEGILGTSPFLAQVFIHGDSEHSSVVLIGVPDEAAVQAWAKKTTTEENPLVRKVVNVTRDGQEESIVVDVKNLVRHKMLSEAVMENIKEIATENKLKGFEIPKCLLLVNPEDEFSPQNGLLTPTFKLKRHAIKTKYQAQIELLYQWVKVNGSKPVADRAPMPVIAGPASKVAGPPGGPPIPPV